ncbi:MAG TPA: transglycosylase SLT domain-containing protein [Vicinamibacterales bacterium]|nr:transglycosylase SLT domain-containing protein [Vicinamibacterales bacterium]
MNDSTARSAAIALTLILLPFPSVVAESQGKLTPTAHAALPDDPTDLWLVPTASDRASRGYAQYEPLAEAVERYEGGEYAAALQLASRPSLSKTPLAGYAAYYAGLAQLRQLQTDQARRTFEQLLGRKPSGYLAIASALAAGEAAEAAMDHAAAMSIYQRLAADKSAVSDEVLARLGRTALAAGDRATAASAYVRLHYEYPLTTAGATAATEMEALADQITRKGYEADIGRAQMLFGARRYAEAKAAFAAVRPHVAGDDRELADLRIAESDFYSRNYAAARDALRPYLQKASRLAEARFFYLSAIRDLGDDSQYVALTRALVAEFPDSSWAEEALNNLGTHYILENEDEAAATTFRELYEKFPNGTRAERAAWKYGWWSYKTGDHAETIRVFESAATTFPRSDYRPSFLYWSARAHAKNGSAAQGLARMRLVHTDYANSYYGRLAEGHLRRVGVLPKGERASQAAERPAPSPPALANDATIRLLLAVGLYDDAIGELRHAQRASGNSPVIDATIAWAYHRKGELRRGISLMRRAYPQFLSAGGQQLPAEILQVIFPLTYWTSIQREAKARGLDPYLVAALIAQESTFDPEIRSAANAWGLMQIVPATGRRIARQIGIRGFRTSTLTNPEANLKIGTYYFSRLVQQFGGTYYALASYNAGENRVVRWRSERPGIDEDEFIDDIPFPETQNYVKRILGTAEDYRLLYGSGGGRPQPVVR